MFIKYLSKALHRLIGSSKQKQDLTDFQNLRLKFHEFKYLLRANNEILSIIAEIETRLENDGIGLDFIHSRYIAASAKVYKMIRHLNRISSNRYATLLASFNIIRHNIDDILSSVGTISNEGELILPLLSLERNQQHLAGSKAINLAQIWRSGHPVCDGFVITTHVFRRFMQHTGLDGQLRQLLMLLENPNYSTLLQMSQEIKIRVQKAPLPAEIKIAIEKTLSEFLKRQGKVKLSLRSSAIGEDSTISFAGQYTSLLNVEPNNIVSAYREIIASLYSPQAIIYRRKNDMYDEDAEMAVLAQQMLEPIVSGVIYTRDPIQGEQGPILISAIYGLGLGLVDGSVTPDIFTVYRQNGLKINNTKLGTKANRLIATKEGHRYEKIPPELANIPTLTPEQIIKLAKLGLSLEKEFGRPQDIEWALTKEGNFYILQSRPLQLLQSIRHQKKLDITPLLIGGQTARPGSGAGPAYLIHSLHDLAAFPDGAVLVASHSSPAFSAVLHRAAAIVTDVGGVTGHMASLAREFGIPTLVDVTGATHVIQPGQMITVDAGACRIYPGRVKKLLINNKSTTTKLQKYQIESNKPTWYKATQLITSLTLTDPNSPNFTSAHCSTFHDIIRFVHEKSFQEMFFLGNHLDQISIKQLYHVNHNLPFELWVIDLGGGLSEPLNSKITIDNFISAPGQALMEGFLDPRIAWNKPRPINVRGLAAVFSSAMLSPPPNNSIIRPIGEKAYAIISADYLNFNSRVGYHFAALDCFCGFNQNDNYISFRFSGGAASENQRYLRCELIARILSEIGFETSQNGDVLCAFLKKYNQDLTKERLRDLGRLILFTRQMDMLTNNRQMVDWLVTAFHEGNFNLETLRK